MLKKSLILYRKIDCNILRSVSTSNNPPKWDLFGAVCLERKPVIIPELTNIEKTFQEYLSKVEFEKSMKSLHEIRHEQDIITAEALKKGELSDLDIDATTKQTAQDFEDACNEELLKFKFASTITEDDKKNNTKSLERKLSKHLVLVTEHVIGNKKYFLLPQSLRHDGETLRQTAERILKQTCGDNIKAQIFGNAPVGFYKFYYPKGSNNESKGAKVFIYFARHLSGQITEKSVNYQWLDRKELETILPNDYNKSVQKFLIDES